MPAQMPGDERWLRIIKTHGAMSSIGPSFEVGKINMTLCFYETKNGRLIHGNNFGCIESLRWSRVSIICAAH